MKTLRIYFTFMAIALFLTACASKTPPSAPIMPAEPLFSAEELASLPQSEDGLVLERNIFFTEPERVLEYIDKTLQADSVKDAAQRNKEYAHSLLAMRALVQSQLKNHDAAFEDITSALRQSIQQDAQSRLYALRSIILWRSGKTRGALLDAEYALQKNENTTLAHMAKGLALFEEERAEEACPWLITACESDFCYGIEYVRDKGVCL